MLSTILEKKHPDVPRGSHRGSAGIKVPNQKRDVQQCETMTLGRPLVIRWSINLIRNCLIESWRADSELNYSFDSESWFGSFGILLDWIISTNCCLNSGGPAGAMWDGEGATRKSRSVGTSLFCKQTPLAHFIRLDQINLNDYFAIIYVCFHSSYSNAVVFVALFSSTYYNMAPTHLEKPRNAYCPHVPWTTPRKHPYTPATSVQEPDDSLPIEIGWRSSSQLMVPSLSPLGQVEAAEMSHVRVWLLHVVKWHMSSCLGFGFLCPSCWENFPQQLLSLYTILLMYYVL